MSHARDIAQQLDLIMEVVHDAISFGIGHDAIQWVIAQQLDLIMEIGHDAI